MDNRALAAGIMRFIVVLGFFALAYGVLNQFAMDLFGGMGLAAEGEKTSTLQGYMSAMWLALPALVVFILSVRLVARAVFESRGGVQ